MAKGGCNKCTGSCACKAKKPRAKKAPAKSVIGGRAKAPQVVIMGPTPPVANPYQTIVSSSTPGVNEKPAKTPDKRLMELRQDLARRNDLTKIMRTGTDASWRRETAERRAIKSEIKSILSGKEPSTNPLTTSDIFGFSEEGAKKDYERHLNYQKDFFETILPGYKEKAKQKKTSVVETLRPPEPVVKETQTETEKPKKSYKAGFMSILPEAIKLENVRQRAIVKKPSMSIMETQTEPIELEVAKGGRKNIFEFAEEQQATGKRAILTNAGRPTFQASLEKALAAGAPAPAPAPESPE